MKLIADNGEVLMECPDDSAILAYHADGDLELTLPNMDDEEEVPDYIVAMGGVATMLTSEEGNKIIEDWVNKQDLTRGLH